LNDVARRFSSALNGARALINRVVGIWFGTQVAGLFLLSIAVPPFAAWLRTPVGALGVGLFLLGSALLVGAAVRRTLRGADDELRLSTLIDQDLVGITLVQDGRLAFVNSRFAALFGYEAEELMETPVLDVIDPAGRDTVVENLRKRLDGEVDHLRYRYTGLKKDGETIRVEVYGRRVEWRGRPAVLSLHVDITEEERLREHTRRSQRLQALGELTGAVAHDFNNLLTAIVAPIDLCVTELGPDHPARVELLEAKESASRAVTLTRQLLSFSRQRIYRARMVEMDRLVVRTEPMLGRLVPAGVKIHLEIDDDLPTVEIDPSHFEQVLLNLVTNASEAVDGRGDIWIRVGTEGAGEVGPPDVILEVRDNGKGMAAETRNRVFEPFYTTRSEGTGLGLSTVHGIVTQEGGEITVESTEGKGTTFRIRLPGRDAEPEAADGFTTEREAPVEIEDASILVVDDQETVRRVTVRVLERHGLRTRSASTGREALEIVRTAEVPPDLLLTDVGLPDLNGVELAGRVRQANPSIRVLYMSGHSDESVLGRLARERSSGFVEKPFSVTDLLKAVRAALGRNGEGEARRGA